jgi:hypothetical protein
VGKLHDKTVKKLIKEKPSVRHADGNGLYLMTPKRGDAYWMLRRQFLAAIHQQANVEQARYRYLAQPLCDHFWSHNIAHRTDSTPGYPGHYGCRVRLRKRKLELSWYYNRFVPKKSGEGRSVFSEYIRKEGRFRYHKPAFTRAQDWEQPLIMETEAGLEMLRRLNANQAELCRVVRKSERLLKDLEEHLGGLKEAARGSESPSSEEG